MNEELTQNRDNQNGDKNNITNINNVIIGSTRGLSVNDRQVVINEESDKETVEIHRTEETRSTAEVRTTSEASLAASAVDVQQISNDINNFTYDNKGLYYVLGIVTILLCGLLFVLSFAFGNMDSSIAIYVCAAIAVIGIFLIYMITNLAKHLFKISRKYQLKKLALLIDYAKNINRR